MIGIEYDEGLNKVEERFIEGMNYKLQFLMIIAGEFIELGKF